MFSNRALRAIQIMQQGGYFCQELVYSSWRPRGVFQYRLRDRDHKTIRDLGPATMQELSKADVLVRSTGARYFLRQYFPNASTPAFLTGTLRKEAA